MLFRSKTFLTEVCDSQSEPGINLEHSDAAISTIVSTDRNLRAIRSAQDRRSRAAVVTSLPTGKNDANTGTNGSVNKANEDRERKLSLLHQLDEAAKHRQVFRFVDYILVPSSTFVLIPGLH